MRAECLTAFPATKPLFTTRGKQDGEKKATEMKGQGIDRAAIRRDGCMAAQGVAALTINVGLRVVFVPNEQIRGAKAKTDQENRAGMPVPGHRCFPNNCHALEENRDRREQ